MYGMDIAQVQGIQSKIKSAISELQTMISTLDGQVNALASAWQGPDATAFTGTTWPADKGHLNTALTDLQNVDTQLGKEITQQQTASQ